MDHPDQVAGYVARTVLGEATAPESLSAGAWSTAYALTVAGRAMVLRVSRYGGDFAKDEARQRGRGRHAAGTGDHSPR